MYNGYFAVRRRPLTPLTPLRWLDEMAIKKQQQLWTIGSFIFRVANSTAGEMQERDTIARPDVFFYPTTGHNQIMTFHIFIYFFLSLFLYLLTGSWSRYQHVKGRRDITAWLRCRESFLLFFSLVESAESAWPSIKMKFFFSNEKESELEGKRGVDNATALRDESAEKGLHLSRSRPLRPAFTWSAR